MTFLTSLTAVGGSNGGTNGNGGATTATGVIEFLIGLATNPVSTLWNLLQTLLYWLVGRFILGFVAEIFSGLQFIVVGDSLALERTGRPGLTDIVYRLVVAIGGGLGSLVGLYFDVVIAVVGAVEPSTGTALDAAVATVALVAILFVTGALLYRLLIGLADAIPVLSGVQTFLTK